MRPLVLCLLLALPIGSVASDDTLRAPRWSARAQFAGMQGAVSMGGLWNNRDGRLQAGLLYGYAPARDGIEAFRALAFRLNGSLLPMRNGRLGKWHLSPTMALTGLLEFGTHAYLTQPDGVPDGYYGQQALHALIAFGGRGGRCNDRYGWSLTAEAVALDTYLWYSVIQRSVPFVEAWSLALGAEFHF